MHQAEILRAQFHVNQSEWISWLSTGIITPTLPHPRLFRAGDTLAMRPNANGVIMLSMHGEPTTVLTEHHEALRWLRASGAQDALVWAMQPDAALDLELLAQGYQPGANAHWMTRDTSLPIASPQHEIRQVTDGDGRSLIDQKVPYATSNQIPLIQLLSSHQDSRVIWLAAIVDELAVGQVIINLTDHHAALFNVGVSGVFRHRGIGTSLILAALTAAREAGIATVNLNSTTVGIGMYTRAGFEHFGTGQTWIRSGARFRTYPNAQEASLVRAIGMGDTSKVQAVWPIETFANGLTSQQLAARFGQDAMMRHLINLGNTPDIIALWQMGLREEAIAATHHGEAREMITGSQRATPLHHAVQLGAGTLVLKLLAMGANLQARDGEHNATPLDWAYANNRPTIARIIKQAGGT